MNEIEMPRSLGKESWKFVYRLFRIARRESFKAAMDMVAYGTGIVEITANGPRHIPVEEWRSFDGN